MKPERLDRKVVHKSPWVNLYLDKVRFPGGRIIDDYHLIDFEKESVAIVVENEKDEILMIQAYRYTTDSIEWEIPAGGIEKGESIIETSKREILEETGYEVDNLEHIYTYNPSNGNSNQVFHIVKCKVMNKVSDKFDKNEVKEYKWICINEVKNMIKKNEIHDGMALSGILLFLQGF